MASLSLSPQSETNAISNGKVIERLEQLKSAQDHAKNYINVRPSLFRHFCVIIYLHTMYCLHLLCLLRVSVYFE